MSYPKDLDEYSEADLRAELDRRAALREQGLCDYCGRPGQEKTCKERSRHSSAAIRQGHLKRAALGIPQVGETIIKFHK